MPVDLQPRRRGTNCSLWINDTPDYRPADHGFGYRDREQPVAVSFISRSGEAWRASFDPTTGEISTFRLGNDAEF